MRLEGIGISTNDWVDLHGVGKVNIPVLWLLWYTQNITQANGNSKFKLEVMLSTLGRFYIP